MIGKLRTTHGMIKATHQGTLFDGLLDCYVLEDERRVVSQRGVVRALTGDANGSAPLGQYLRRLPQRFSHLATQTAVEFVRPAGGVANGRDVLWLSEVLDAYVDAFMAGELHPQQARLAQQARMVQSAASKVGWMALIDEATQYQLVREATALSFAYRAILLESTCAWDLMWTPEFVESVCTLHGVAFDGTQPRFLASTYDKLYRLILGDDDQEREILMGKGKKFRVVDVSRAMSGQDTRPRVLVELEEVDSFEGEAGRLRAESSQRLLSPGSEARHTDGMAFDWRAVAHTFDGYKAAGGLAACAETASRVREGIEARVPLDAFTTDELRTALFFAVRAERHTMDLPTESPHEEAIVAELVRRNGEAWLRSELARR